MPLSCHFGCHVLSYDATRCAALVPGECTDTDTRVCACTAVPLADHPFHQSIWPLNSRRAFGPIWSTACAMRVRMQGDGVEPGQGRPQTLQFACSHVRMLASLLLHLFLRGWPCRRQSTQLYGNLMRVSAVMTKKACRPRFSPRPVSISLKWGVN